jgi:hypothetical protein
VRSSHQWVGVFLASNSRQVTSLPTKGYIMPLVELQNVLNYLVTDLPHLGRARSALTAFDSHGSGQPTKKRPLEEPQVEGTKSFQRCEGFGHGRGRGNRGGRGRTSPIT